jgi:hypothetical protein
MNKQGQVTVGVILLLAIALLVGLVIFQQIASNVDAGTRTNSGTVVATNSLITGILNTKVELTGQELVSVQAVTNRTDGTTVAAANYTIAECVRPSDGLKGICYTATGSGAPKANGPINVSYTYYPAGYIDDSAGRSMFGLIVLLAAIAIAIIVLAPLVKQGWD